MGIRDRGRPEAEEETNKRSSQDGCADQEAKLWVRKAEIRLYLDADNGKNRPDRETNGEGDCG